MFIRRNQYDYVEYEIEARRFELRENCTRALASASGNTARFHPGEKGLNMQLTISNMAPPDHETAVLPHQLNCSSNYPQQFDSLNLILTHTHVKARARTVRVYTKWHHIWCHTLSHAKGADVVSVYLQ